MEIKIDLEGVIQTTEDMERIEHKLANPQPALKAIAEHHLTTVDNRFRDQRGPTGPWRPLSSVYLKRKLRAKPPAINKILQFTGLMRAGINYQVDGRRVKIGSDKIYAATQEYGDMSRNIPDRPFLRPVAEDEQEFIEIFKDHLLS